MCRSIETPVTVGAAISPSAQNEMKLRTQDFVLAAILILALFVTIVNGRKAIFR